MPGYDNPLTISYSFGSVNFATTPAASAIRPPKGFKRGNIRDIHVSVATLFTQTTTPAFIRLGTTGTPAKYAELNMGAAAATDAYNLSNTGAKPAVADLDVDAIAQIEVVFVAPTGGTPAGAGVVIVVIDWF